MKLSGFVNITRPYERQDPIDACLASLKNLCDEVVVVCGCQQDLDDFKDYTTVLYEWKGIWEDYGNSYKVGYDACEGDWVIRADADYVFHEADKARIRQFLENSKQPAVSFMKKQFVLADRWNIKSRITLAVKGNEDVDFHGGRDAAQITLNGKYVNPDTTEHNDLVFYNYDFTFRDKETLKREFWKQAKARLDNPELGRKWGENADESLEWILTQLEKKLKEKPWNVVDIYNHPEFIREDIKNITEDKLGYNLFGRI